MASKVGTVAEVVEHINNNTYNQAQLALDAHSIFAAIQDGDVDFFDASSPFSYSLSFTAMCAAANANQIEAIHRKLYPVLARTEEDLNRHLSGSENYSRWATPASSEIHFITDVASILKYAVTDSNGIKKLIIPEETVFTVGGRTYGLYHPVTIRVMDNDNLSILLNTDEDNPLHEPSTNEIEYVYRTTQYDPNGSGELLAEAERSVLVDMTLPVYQFTRSSYQEVLNASVGFSQEYALSDKLMSVRVWTGSDLNGWREMDVVFSNEIYDNQASTPVATIATLTDTVKVSVPQIFFSRNLMGSKLKVAVYTTEGDIELSLRDFDTTEFQVAFNDTNPLTSTYSAAMRSLSVSSAYSRAMVLGGSDGKTFEEVRNMVIYNTNRVSIPVTPAQLQQSMADKGYDLVVFKDYLTEKLYLATRSLEDITVSNTPVTPSTGFTTLRSTIEDLVKLDTVVDNNTQITILPKSLYSLVDDVLTILSDSERTTIDNLPATTKVANLNNNHYLYSPYYYVMDISDSSYFEYRGYHLDNPSYISKFFESALETTSLSVSTNKVNFNKVDSGWELIVETNASSALLDGDDDIIGAQLSFIGRNDTNYAGLNGTLVGRTDDGNFIFKFILETNYQIASNDDVYLTNFRIQENDLLAKSSTLLNDFRLVYHTKEITSSNLDGNLVYGILEFSDHALNVETIRLKLGYALTNLYTRSRATSLDQVYQTYDENILAYYPSDIYEEDGDGAYTLIDNPEYPDNSDDAFIFNKLHSAGDPIIDETTGLQKVLHYKGDPVLIGNELQVESERKLGFYIELLMLDAKFRYVTESSSKALGAMVANSVIDYLDQDIDGMRSVMLGGSELKLYPKRNLGSVDVKISEGQQTTINGQQRLNFRVYLADEVYDDSKAVTLINNTIRTIASQKLNQVSVNVDEIKEAIREEVGGSIISIAMDGLGDNNTLDRFTLVNAHESVNLALDLELQSDGTIRLVSGITITPYRASEESDR